MKISYAITVCTEAQEFRQLLNFLVPLIREEDEIVVLQDVSKKSEEVDKVFIDFADHIETRVTSKFQKDFAAWKNMLNSYCTGEYIFQLDADEIPEAALIEKLPKILEYNAGVGVDLIWVPRDNRVEGLTADDIRAWHWRVDEKGRVNWPDLQGRIYRNVPNLKWEGKVHEKITGVRTYAFLPDDLFLHHNKAITKQREQNALYNTIQR